MNNDILPPRRPGAPGPNGERRAQVDSVDPASPPQAMYEERANELTSSRQPPQDHKRSLKKKAIIVLGVFVIAIIGVLLAAFAWYSQQLRSVSSDDQAPLVRIVVESGSTPNMIAAKLAEEGLIRSETAFAIYTHFAGVRNSLQAGTFSISPAESTQEIVTHFTAGQNDEISLTFFPGATLRDTTSTAEERKVDHKTVLLRAGYGESEIEAAFKKDYDHPIFQDKPSSADIEGYVYGETYNFSSSASVEQILTRTFDEFYDQISERNLIEKFDQQGLNLYEGIIMASIIQREVPTPEDQRQVAQIFYKRYNEGMMLGSDVTYHYAADKAGVPRDFRLNSPYNTRRFTGLPPGPIAVPGLTALEAAANPADGDFVYFLSGDDDVTYFARTQQEHDSNIVKHCRVKCALP